MRSFRTKRRKQRRKQRRTKRMRGGSTWKKVAEKVTEKAYMLKELSKFRPDTGESWDEYCKRRGRQATGSAFGAGVGCHH